MDVVEDFYSASETREGRARLTHVKFIKECSLLLRRHHLHTLGVSHHHGGNMATAHTLRRRTSPAHTQRSEVSNIWDAFYVYPNLLFTHLKKVSKA